MYRIHVESYAQSTRSHLYETVKKKKRYASSLLHINQKNKQQLYVAYDGKKIFIMDKITP